MDYSKTTRHITHFGNVKIVFVNKKTTKDLLSSKEIVKDSHYLATVLDGEYNGWFNEGLIRSNCLSNLMSLVAADYGYRMISDLEDKT